MSGVEAVHLRFREIFEESFPALRGEKYVVLRPENDCTGLVTAQTFLPFRVQLDIGAVVVEEVELHALCLWPREEIQVHVPIVGADELRISMPMCIDRLHRVRLEKCCKRPLCVGIPLLPIRVSQSIPDCSESDFIGIAVLDDEPLKPCRM